MSARRWAARLVAVPAALALLGLGAGPATAGDTPKPCQLLKRAQIEAAFDLPTARRTRLDARCLWLIDDRFSLATEIVSEDAEAEFESFAELFTAESVDGVGDEAAYGVTESSKVLLALERDRMLFMSLLDVANELDPATVQAAMVQLGKRAVRKL
jgi:hypothetical protein